MKKIVYLLTIALIALTVACSGGHYSQKVVDDILERSGHLSDQDYKEIIQQANYALDDLEKATNRQQWIEDNQTEYASLANIVLGVELAQTFGELPESLDSDADKLIDRFIKNK